MTIGIVGSRRRSTAEDFGKVLAAYQTVEAQRREHIAKNSLLYFDLQLVSGGCPQGGDAFAEEIAKTLGLTITIHYPRKRDVDKQLLRKNPRAAMAQINYARNQLIAQDADMLIACVAPDRKGGTEDTIKRFLRRFYSRMEAKSRERLALQNGILILV